MKSWRKLHRSTFENEDLGVLSSNAFQLFVAIIVYADDEGRIKAGPAYLRGKAFRYRDDVKVDDVRVYRDALTQAVGLQVYQVDGEDYAYLPNWTKWQGKRSDRFQASELPKPPRHNSPNEWQPTGNHVATNGCQPGNQLATNWQPTGNHVATERRVDKKREEGEGARFRGEGYPIDIETPDASPAPRNGEPPRPPSSASRGPGERAQGPEDQENNATGPSAAAQRQSDKPDTEKKDLVPEPDILALVDTYCELHGMSFANEAARATYRKQRPMFYPARDLLVLCGGDLARARLCLKDLAEFYESKGRVDWTWSYALEDFAKWEKLVKEGV